LTLAPHYRSASGWNALLAARQPREELPPTWQVASIVVGAGYTGLAAARRLGELEPGREVLVIEASELGEGAAGRNSGFLSALPTEPLAHGEDTADHAAARQIQLARAGLELLRRLVIAHGIDCGWDEEAPRFDAAATTQGVATIAARQSAQRHWGLAGHFVERAELTQLTGTTYYRRAYSPHGNVFVQPAALIRGLGESLPENVHLLERTEVTSVSRTGLLRVATTRGEFLADRVLIAANAHARSFGLLRDRMIAIYTYGGLTPELDQVELAKLGVLPQWGIIPAHRMGTTLRKFANCRFLVRSGDSYERELPLAQVRTMLTRLYRRRYPQMASHQLE
jgi:glycine/D-amino acid oxidase-like deaminating enzyme